MIVRAITAEESDINGLTVLMNQWDDLPVKLSLEYIRKRVNEFMAMPNAAIMVAQAPGGDLAGYACVSEVVFLGMNPYIELQSILVREDVRGRGVGAALMKAVEEWTLEKGFGTILLTSRTQLSRSHEFYKRLGYRVIKQSYYFKKEIGGTGL